MTTTIAIAGILGGVLTFIATPFWAPYVSDYLDWADRTVRRWRDR